jgi:hypothetical protein
MRTCAGYVLGVDATRGKLTIRVGMGDLLESVGLLWTKSVLPFLGVSLHVFKDLFKETLKPLDSRAWFHSADHSSPIAKNINQSNNKLVKIISYLSSIAAKQVGVSLVVVCEVFCRSRRLESLLALMPSWALTCLGMTEFESVVDPGISIATKPLVWTAKALTKSGSI